MKEKIDYGTPWVKVGLRIFPGLSEAKEYCERKDISLSEMEYDNEKNYDASVMAAQQIAILNEVYRKIELRIASNIAKAEHYEGLSQKAKSICKLGRSADGWMQASCDVESYYKMVCDIRTENSGLYDALGILHDMDWNLSHIAFASRINEPRDVK